MKDYSYYFDIFSKGKEEISNIDYGSHPKDIEEMASHIMYNCIPERAFRVYITLNWATDDQQDKPIGFMYYNDSEWYFYPSTSYKVYRIDDVEGLARIITTTARSIKNGCNIVQEETDFWNIMHKLYTMCQKNKCSTCYKSIHDICPKDCDLYTVKEEYIGIGGN